MIVSEKREETEKREQTEAQRNRLTQDQSVSQRAAAESDFTKEEVKHIKQTQIQNVTTLEKWKKHSPPLPLCMERFEMQVKVVTDNWKY